MSEYNVGDLVEAVKGETKYVGRVFSDYGLYVGENGPRLAYLEVNGFTVTVLEKAVPALPTEHGWYQAEAHGTKYLFQLSEHDLGWFYVGNEYQPAPRRRTPNDAESRGGLTRLEPVTVTVQKVIDYLVNVQGFQPGGIPKCISREFGLSS